MTYEIHPLREGDLPLIWTWLQEPHVQAWWANPQVQYDLIAGDLYDPTIHLHLVGFQGTPFAYIQDYCVQDWMQAHLTDRPQGTRAIDTFIGDPRFLGKGHGAGFLRQHAQALVIKEAPQVILDPEPNNQVAIRAYKSAGFKEIAIRQSDDGPALLMQFAL